MRIGRWAALGGAGSRTGEAGREQIGTGGRGIEMGGSGGADWLGGRLAGARRGGAFAVREDRSGLW